MVKRTYKAFAQVMEILQSQAYMSQADAERKARSIFKAVEHDRQAHKKVTVEQYLIVEIENAIKICAI